MMLSSNIRDGTRIMGIDDVPLDMVAQSGKATNGHGGSVEDGSNNSTL